MTLCKRVILVRGYHLNTPIPAPALRANLRHRFAVVFDTEDTPEMEFDAKLFCDILHEISTQIPYDEINIELDDGLMLSSVSELLDSYSGITESEEEDEDREPPKRIRYSISGRASCHEETEFWVLCGGPPPYHDSYTFSFFTACDMSDSLAWACRVACSGVNSLEMIDASSEPVSLSWWKHVLEWMRNVLVLAH